MAKKLYEEKQSGVKPGATRAEQTASTQVKTGAPRIGGSTTGKVNNSAQDLYGTTPEYPQYGENNPFNKGNTGKKKTPVQPTAPVQPGTPESNEDKMTPVDPDNQREAPNIDGTLPQYNFDYGDNPQFKFDGNKPQFNTPDQDAAAHQAYEDAMEALEQAKGKTPTYGSQYDDQIHSLYEQIIGRKAFQYDSKTDPL